MEAGRRFHDLAAAAGNERSSRADRCVLMLSVVHWSVGYEVELQLNTRSALLKSMPIGNDTQTTI